MNRDRLACKTASNHVAKVIADIQRAARGPGANLVPEQATAQFSTMLAGLLAIHADLSNYAEGVTATDGYTVPETLKAKLRDATKRIALFQQLANNYLEASRMAPM